MLAIYLALTVAILLVNLAGLAAALARWLPDTQIARAAGVLGLCLLGFFAEHFVGLGGLSGLWPVSTAVAAWLLWRRRGDARAIALAQLPFAVPFLLVLGWRLAYPDLEPTAEKITDLYFVSNYLGGDTLPPPDRWLPGYRFDFYYGFLHYGTALLGRWLGLAAGPAMNLGGALVFGLLGSLGWSVAGRWVRPPALRGLLVAALLLGGTGIAPLLTALYPGNAIAQVWANTRFIGLYDQEIPVAWGQAWFGKAAAPGSPEAAAVRDLPLETPSYLLHLGDVHPPLGGFVLLFFALALMARLERAEDGAAAGGDDRLLAGALGATVPLTLAVNTWVFPLQALLVAGWLAYRWRGRQALHGRPLALGGAAALFLLYPFLGHFAPNALSTPLVLTGANDHTPWRQGLVLWWPIAWLVALSLLQGPGRRLAWWSGLAVLAFWLLGEFVTVDDPGGDRYQRFNTTLKWWSWLYPAALVWLSALNLARPNRLWRALALLPAVAVLTYLLPLAHSWIETPRPHAGRLQGDGWLRDDRAQRAIVDWLRAAPRGLVLESVEQGAYSPSSAFALHAGQPSAAGWPDHESQWRGSPDFINERTELIRAIYRGNRPDALQWLRSQKVRYLVWSRYDQARGPAVLEQLKMQLAPGYAWLPLWTGGDEQYGVFRRLD
ncbi:DUF2298 domain-containing protein [Chitinimonas koreensis]|uniref:DUF2298 domain-containing protein n=1 Tax=Chitinimonas koreensis TaxID=356302 RepID=UPI00041E6127|nr:DUF2298 domain-containing protein [Chitinimonas koreensis]QNM97138.1 hypothetical protein H9L41_02045 [Chitinimonas koreensis]